MTDEIRAARIFVPHRIKPAARDGREENETDFRRKLAELAQDPEGGDGDQRRPSVAPPEPVSKEDGGSADGDDDGKLGRNLDLRT